jgi:hypothetical protein
VHGVNLVDEVAALMNETHAYDGVFIRNRRLIEVLPAARRHFAQTASLQQTDLGGGRRFMSSLNFARIDCAAGATTYLQGT